MCWTTGLSEEAEFGMLNCDEAPSRERINAYQAWLIEMEDVLSAKMELDTG